MSGKVVHFGCERGTVKVDVADFIQFLGAEFGIDGRGRGFDLGGFVGAVYFGLLR